MGFEDLRKEKRLKLIERGDEDRSNLKKFFQNFFQNFKAFGMYYNFESTWDNFEWVGIISTSMDGLGQCFSTAGTRPGTGTWRPSYWDLNNF